MLPLHRSTSYKSFITHQHKLHPLLQVELLGTIYIKSNDQALFIGFTKYLFMPPWPWVTYISGCDVYGQVLVMAWIRSTGTHSLGLDIPSALSFDTSLQNLSSTLHCSSTALV